MAENTADKEALKAAKEAEKAAKKAKQERVKQSKPKKEGNVFSRAGKSVKKFWKDFTGTVKKVVWPGAKQVLKSSLIVLVSIVVVGLVIFGIDEGLTALFRAGSNLAVSAGEQLAAQSADETTEAGETEAEDETAAEGDEADEAEETTEEETAAEETEAEETEAEETAAE